MENVKEKIKKILNEKIKPILAFDGGNVEFVDFKDGTVRVKLKGACFGCPMSEFTLKESVEKILKEEIPEVKKVEEV